MDKTKKTKIKERKSNAVYSSDLPFKTELTDEEVLEHFSKLMEEMNLSLDKREPLLSKSIDEKRLIIAQTHNNIDNSPTKYVNSLANIVDRRCNQDKVVAKLDSLRVYLSSSPLSMVKEFNDANNNGLSLLTRVLALYLDNADIALMTLKCLRAFGNCGYGLLTLIQNRDTLVHVALCLTAHQPSVMLLAVELLTLFTFYSFESHSNVMDVLYQAARIRDCEERFTPIVDGLAAGIAEKHTNLLVPCLQFINVIVNPNFKDINTCSDLDSNYSMHLRIEFVRCGLNTLMDKILASNPDELVKKNVLVFQSDNDFEEDYLNKFDLVSTCLKDRDTAYQMLARTLSNTACDIYLTSLLKHLLIIKDNPIRYHLYRLLDDVVAEIILHSDGMCPDPMLNQLDSYNLTELFEKFSDPKNNTGNEIQDKLDKVLAEKHEAETKLYSLENKLVIGTAPTTSPIAPPPPGIIAPPPPGIIAPPPPPPPGSSAPPTNGVEQKLPFGMRIKAPLKPKLPMKKANWKKVETKLLEKNCIWKKINDDEMNITDALKELGERFSTKSSTVKFDADVTDAVISHSSLPRKVKEFKVLDAKSGQNLAILSGSLKVPYNEIKRRIIELDESLLSQTNVENLSKNLPPEEQLTKLSKMSDDYENLNEAEQFGYTLASIKGLHSRLNSLLFKMKFSERVSEIKPSIICATEALSEVKKSPSLPCILELVLQFGNFMNNSSKSSLTVGFHLSFLTKLTDTKDCTGDVTLMEFLVTQIKNRFPSLLNIVGELSYLEKATRVSTETINSTIADMKSIKNSLDRELKSYKKQADNDNYLEVMKSFLVSVNEQLDLISAMNSKLHETYKDTSKYFAFDLSKYPMEEFFHDMKQFRDDFHQSVTDIETVIQLNIKRQKAKEEKVRRETEKVEQRKKATREEDDGVLDNLLATLNSGDAYGCRSDNRNRRKKKEKLHMVNRSRSRRDFDKDMIISSEN